MQGVAARKLAVEVLTKVETDEAYSNIALSAAFKRKTLSERDRAFTTALVQGALRHREELDAEIASVSSQPLNKMKPVLRNLLRIAVFQLRFMSDIPTSAVLNTSTEIGKAVGHAGIGKFVAGVLRAYVRKVEASGADESTLDLTTSEGLAKKYSMPHWLVTRWLERWGAEETAKLLAYTQSVPELIVRTCESGIETDALVRLFKSNGIKVRQGSLVESCLIIEDRGKYKGPIEKLPGYTDGLFTVQDEAASFASKVVNPSSEDAVVDLCAAPGGKSIHLAEMMEGKGRVLAVDSNGKRLELLKATRQRVGLTNIEVIVADGTTFQPNAPVDKVLIDAPCTGTGVLNRRPDLRFKREAPDIVSLVELQRRLLDNAARFIKPGGVLVYSTCSLEYEENEGNLRWFIETHPEFYLSPLTEFAAKTFITAKTKDQLEKGWIELLPTQHGVSGFFVARLIKKN